MPVGYYSNQTSSVYTLIKGFPVPKIIPRVSLVSDIPAGDGKTINLFFTVYTHLQFAYFLQLSTKRVKYPPILELPLVVVELDAARVLHAAHDVDHILLFHHHDGGVVSPFLSCNRSVMLPNNIRLLIDSKNVSSPTSNQSGKLLFKI
jgi:hypothetical protein